MRVSISSPFLERTRHYRRALRARYVVSFNYIWINAIYITLLLYYTINPSVHNCQNMQWQSLKKQAQLENQSASRKSGNNTSIYASNRFNMPFLKKISISTYLAIDSIIIFRLFGYKHKKNCFKLCSIFSKC